MPSPSHSHSKGDRILRMPIADLRRADLARLRAEEAADEYEAAGEPETAARIRQAIKPIRPRGRQPTREWAELRDWLVDDVIGILTENVTLKISVIAERLSSREPWTGYSGKALEEQWRTFWKANGFNPKDALAEIKRRL
jgi:hypothetical protein